MAKTHTVQQGEHLSEIASDAGFRDFHTIWDRPENAALRGSRDPHVLFPGDQLFIPDLKPKSEARATGSVHLFLLPAPELFLRLKVLDLDNRPVANATGDLKLEFAAPEDVSTDPGGFVIHELEPKTHVGQLKLEETQPDSGDESPEPPQKLRFDLRIGHLNPETKLSGQQARLNNLGYFAGFTLNDLEQLLWAAEEFECDRINQSKARVAKRPPLVAVRPEDQKDGQEQGDPEQQTGISDAKIQAELAKSHGC